MADRRSPASSGSSRSSRRNYPACGPLSATPLGKGLRDPLVRIRRGEQLVLRRDLPIEHRLERTRAALVEAFLGAPQRERRLHGPARGQGLRLRRQPIRRYPPVEHTHRQRFRGGGPPPRPPPPRGPPSA